MEWKREELIDGESGDNRDRLACEMYNVRAKVKIDLQEAGDRMIHIEMSDLCFSKMSRLMAGRDNRGTSIARKGGFTRR